MQFLFVTLPQILGNKHDKEAHMNHKYYRPNLSVLKWNPVLSSHNLNRSALLCSGAKHIREADPSQTSMELPVDPRPNFWQINQFYNGYTTRMSYNRYN